MVEALHVPPELPPGTVAAVADGCETVGFADIDAAGVDPQAETARMTAMEQRMWRRATGRMAPTFLKVGPREALVTTFI